MQCSKRTRTRQWPGGWSQKVTLSLKAIGVQIMRIIHCFVQLCTLGRRILTEFLGKAVNHRHLWSSHQTTLRMLKFMSINLAEFAKHKDLNYSDLIPIQFSNSKYYSKFNFSTVNNISNPIQFLIKIDSMCFKFHSSKCKSGHNI